MAKPLAEVLLEGMAKAKATERDYRMVAWTVRIVTAEVHSYLSGTCCRPAWEVIDALEAAADELRRHGEGLEVNDG